jgi:putative hydrolases of HD superfamily
MMITKADNPIAFLSGKDVHPLIRAYFDLCQLKQLYRQGWLRRGIDRQRCETVAEHSFATAMLAMWLGEAYFKELDMQKIIQIALIHDLGEIYAGDIIPSDSVHPAEKRRLEVESVQRVAENLPEGSGCLNLWEEFEQGRTPEARLVRQADRLEMGLQAAVYRLQGFVGMDEFMTSAQQGLDETALVQIIEEARRLMEEHTGNQLNSAGEATD